MQIEVGKSYRNEIGKKVGPMVRWSGKTDAPWSESSTLDSNPIYRDDGTNPYGLPALVSEWGAVNSPVRTETITRTVIEPGVYGRLRVDAHEGDSVILTLSDVRQWNATELRELARIGAHRN